MLTLKEGEWMIYRDFMYSLCNFHVSLECFKTKEFLIFFKCSIYKEALNFGCTFNNLENFRIPLAKWHPRPIKSESLVGATQALLFELFEWFQCAHTPLYKKLLVSSSLMLYLRMDMKVNRQDKTLSKLILEISVKYLLTTTAHFLKHKYT